MHFSYKLDSVYMGLKTQGIEGKNYIKDSKIWSTYWKLDY